MKLENVSKNYDRLARSYDFWDRWVAEPLAGISGLREQTVATLDLAAGHRVLDIGCGTGLNLPLLVAAVGPEGSVVALDYSQGMLDRAQLKVERSGWRNVVVVQGDAAKLAGVGEDFDAVMSTWALGIVDDLPSALRRAVEVLKPGGRLTILDLHRTRASSGLRRHVLDPVVHCVLRAAGVDSKEDLDEDRLWARWQEGKAFLRESLDDVRVQENGRGSGFQLTGRKP